MNLTVMNGGKNVDHFKFSAMGIILLLEFEGKKWNPGYILGKRVYKHNKFDKNFTPG